MPAFSVLTSPSFPGKQDQRGRGTGPRSHRSLDPSCRRPPTHPAWPKRPASPGRAAPAPTWPKAQAGIRPPPSPPSPSPRAAPSGLREAPPSTSAQQDLSLSCSGTHPRNLTHYPPKAAPETRIPGLRGPGEGGREDAARGKIPPAPPSRASGRCARKGRAGRWADKRGDRQGLAYHGAVALGAHRAPRDRAAPGGRAGAAP